MIELSSISPEWTVRIIIAVLVWVWASLLIMFHRKGIEWVGTVMVIVGTFLFIWYPTSLAPWVLLVCGVFFHAMGRLRRWKTADKKISE